MEFSNDILTELNLDHRRFFVLGDMNINTSKRTNCSKDYLNLLISNCATNIIDVSTRVTTSSTTILDHIITNENKHQIFPAVVDYDITHLYLVMALVNNESIHKNAQPKFARSLAKVNSDSYNNDFQKRINSFLPKILTISENNLDDIFNEFYLLITSTIDTHAPLKKLSRKQRRLRSKPWISKGLLISIKKKQKLYKTHYNFGSINEKLYYKKYSNLLTKVKNLAKKLYYHQKLDDYSDNPKKTWKILGILLSSKSNSTVPNFIIVNNLCLNDPTDIVEEFNNHFASIAKSSVTSISDDNNNNKFLNHLKNPCSFSIYSQSTSPQEVINLINSLKSYKAGGYDDILPYFLKISGYIIALPFSLILNCCLTAGIFPRKLKFAKVVPVYKKEPTDRLTNYRPISLLPSLSKVFERIICNRLLSFFTSMNTIVPTQYGFRHNRYTIHATLDLITTCYDNLNCKKFLH